LSWRLIKHQCIFLLNTDAEFNVISQHFTVTNEMIKLNAKISLSSSEWSLHLLLWGISDEVSAKRQLRSETQLWTCLLCLEKNEPDLIMSLSALEKKQVHIDCELCSWHFSINSQMLSLKDLNKFEETAEASNLHFSLSCTQIADGTPARHCYSVIYTSGICWLCWCFLKVWSRMSLHMRSTIMSLTIMRRTLHTALYTICQTRNFKFYRSYLNDTLVKGWIQHFVSSQRRQCYSPQRKTVACCVLTTVS
jgi:hypothetical protein